MIILAASLSEKDEIGQEKDPRIVMLASFDPAKIEGRILSQFRESIHNFLGQGVGKFLYGKDD